LDARFIVLEHCDDVLDVCWVHDTFSFAVNSYSTVFPGLFRAT
jgi:hypothetical protein